MKRPTVTVLSGRDQRVRRGHPWVYSNEVQMDTHAKALPAGSLVKLQTEDGQSLGIAGFNPHTLIAVRRLDAEASAKIDAAWFAAKFKAAADLRAHFFAEPYYRLCHAEADGLGGLIVDLYGDVAVVQANSAVMNQCLDAIVEVLRQVLPLKAILHVRAGAAVQYEGLDERSEILWGELPQGALRLRENGATFFADPLGGQKTGWFYDQRDSRAASAALVKNGRVLDVYSYAGGFGVLAALNAKAATLIDRSEGALALAKQAAEANGVADKCRFIKSDAMDALERLAAEGERFEVVIADPPAFIKAKKDMAAGLKGYRKLARLAAPLVEPKGFLCLGSCSHHADLPSWSAENTRGIYEAGRTGRLIKTLGAGADHPVHPLLPESAYLKFQIYQLD